MKDYYGKRAVIYGLGYEYKKQESFIKSEFDIVGYSDRKEHNIPLYVRPADLVKLSFDYIYVTSHKLFEEIKKDILSISNGKINECQILSFDDVWGDFGHIRDEWVRTKLEKIEDGKILLDAGAGEQKYAPFCSLTHMAPYYFANGFSEFWYKEHLEAHGFEIRELTPDGSYFKYMAQELFRTVEMAGKYCDIYLNQEQVSALSKAVKIMSGLSLADSDSAETLCFGYMVEAYKR